MEKMILFLLKRRLIVFLLTFLIVIAGIGSLLSFNIELVPKTNFPVLSVNLSRDVLIGGTLAVLILFVFLRN